MLEYFKTLFQKISNRPASAGLRFHLTESVLIALAGVIAMFIMAWNVATDVQNAVYRTMWLLICCVPLIMFHRGIAKKGYFAGRRLVMLVSMLMLQMLALLGVNSLYPYMKGLMPDMASYGMLLVLPYMLAPAVASMLVSPRFGTYAALSATMLGLPLFPSGTPYYTLVEYVSVSFLAGVVGAALAGRAHRREQILYSGAATGLVVFFAVALLGIFQGADRAGDGNGVTLLWLGVALFFAVGSNFLLMVIVGGLMPMFEKIFCISTHITWLEWADMNHPLLKSLQMSAPGTFHHSLCVQRLAEGAAEAIGADVTRAGVCALYHDIGKLDSPQYFAENIPDQANSPHRSMTPEGSARIITGHVQQGVELATAYKLNRRIVDVIREHHGVSTAYFFYRKATDRYEEDLAKFEEGLTDTSPEPVDKAVFSYKGPIPQTRESGIVSMADAVESATRSLQHPTEQDIRNMVESIFKGRILDGHLQDSGLTLGDIDRMKKSFFHTLRTMNHNRIAYPKPKEEQDAVAIVAEGHKPPVKEDAAKGKKGK